MNLIVINPKKGRLIPFLRMAVLVPSPLSGKNTLPDDAYIVVKNYMCIGGREDGDNVCKGKLMKECLGGGPVSLELQVWAFLDVP